MLTINNAYRASELLSIRIGQVRHLTPGDRLEVMQRKTRRYRAVIWNRAYREAVAGLLAHLDEKALAKRNLAWVDDQSFLFAGRRPDTPLSVPFLNNLVKAWCHQANLRGNYDSHSLRKTWGYMQGTRQRTPIPTLIFQVRQNRRGLPETALISA